MWLWEIAAIISLFYHNFKIVNINKDIIIKTLEESLETATRKNVTLDTIKVIKEYLNNQND